MSPFVGRLGDIGETGMDVVKDIVEIFKNYNLDTEVIVASVRDTEHAKKSALYGAHIATIPFKVLEEMFKHDLTNKGIQRFLEDYKKIPKQ